MKQLMILLCAFALFSTTMLTSGCKKSGCTDPDAVNYDPDAKEDDGTCTYFSDLFAGNYVAHDTSGYINPNNQMWVYTNYVKSFAIEKEGATAVHLPDFWDCELNATVSNTSMVITGSVGQCYISNFVCNRNGDVLTYQFETYYGVTYHVAGTAVKQQ